MKKEAKFFKALADDTRLAIIALLSWKEELCVCDILTVLELTQSKASRHLRYLTQAGILEDRREAVWVYYRVASDLPPLEAGIIRDVQSHFDSKGYAALKKKLDSWLARKGGKPLCKCT